MKKLTINGEIYEIPEKLDEINTFTWFKCFELSKERQIKKSSEMGDGTKDYVYFDVEDESDEFKSNKELKIIETITLIPFQILDEYAQATSIVKQIMNFDLFEIKPIKKIEHKNKTWTYTKVENWPFIQFADFEMASKNPLLQLKMVLTTKEEKKYDTYHKNIGTKSFVEDLPCTVGAALLISILNDLKIIRTKYPFIFMPDANDSIVGVHIQKHYDMFQWDDTIFSLADTMAFNSPKGTVHGVRYANIHDVLDYLNWKRSKMEAEYKDIKSKNKKNQK